MNCPNCGAFNQDGTMVCTSCGANIAQQAAYNSMSQQQQQQQAYQPQPVYQPQQPNYGYPQQPNYGYPQQPNYGYQNPYGYGNVVPAKGMGIAAMICGIISIFLFAIIMGPLGIILGAVAKSKGNTSAAPTTGIVCGVIGVVGWVLLMIMGVSMFM